MDEACGLKKREEEAVVISPHQLHQGTAEVASWNKTKVTLTLCTLSLILVKLRDNRKFQFRHLYI